MVDEKPDTTTKVIKFILGAVIVTLIVLRLIKASMIFN